MGLEQSKHYAVILGARPNFVKAAPFFLEARKYPHFKFTIIHTGQHFDDNMSKIFFEEMEIPQPDFYLDIKAELHTEKLGKMFNALNSLLSRSENNYDGLIVFGDVNSTLAGAIAAKNNNIKLIHIEAGLRSHDRRMPEEINRAIVDHLADLLFTTEPSANDNLSKEGVSPEKIKYVGNIMIESLEIYRDKIEASHIIDELKLASKSYILATIHRQENIDGKAPLRQILGLLNEIALNRPVVFPVHPGTRKKIEKYGLTDFLANLMTIDPLGYFDFIKLIKESFGVITDSGGIQEETTHLGIPCATLRDNTERPITLELGSNKLFNLKLVQSVEIIYHLGKNFKAKPVPLWDDQVSKRIFQVLA